MSGSKCGTRKQPGPAAHGRNCHEDHPDSGGLCPLQRKRRDRALRPYSHPKRGNLWRVTASCPRMAAERLRLLSLKRSPAGRFGGYDRETGHRLHRSRCPQMPGEAAFWAKFDFQPEGAQLGPPPHPGPDRRPVRAGFPRRPAHGPAAVHRRHLRQRRGYGVPVRALGCRRRAGCWALTSSPRPSPPPERHLAQKGFTAELHRDSHANLLQYVTPGTADAVMFNFGWLPGADHAVFSTAGSSIPALEAALDGPAPRRGAQRHPLQRAGHRLGRKAAASCSGRAPCP